MWFARSILPLFVSVQFAASQETGADPDTATNWRIRDLPGKPGQVYYYNEVTGETSYLKPIDPDALSHWHTRKVPNAPWQSFYYNDATGETTYSIPDAFKRRHMYERPDPYTPANAQDTNYVLPPISPEVNMWNVEAQMEEKQEEEDQGIVVPDESLLSKHGAVSSRRPLSLLQQGRGIVVKYKVKVPPGQIAPPPGYVPRAFRSPPAGVMPPSQLGEGPPLPPVPPRLRATLKSKAPIIGVEFHNHLVTDVAGLEEIVQDSSGAGPPDDMAGPPMPGPSLPGSSALQLPQRTPAAEPASMPANYRYDVASSSATMPANYRYDVSPMFSSGEPMPPDTGP